MARMGDRLSRLGGRALIRGLLALVLLGTLLSQRVAWGQEPPQPLTVVLLIDTSFSMGETDPERLRDLAADYLVDFLDANGETLNLNYRLGAAAFNNEVLPNSVPIDLVSVIDLAPIRALTPQGFTDFGPALDYALNELPPEEGSGRRRAVILFTDGRPDRSEQPVEDITAYFDEEIQSRINQLEASGIEVFVVGIGDAVEDRGNWQRVLSVLDEDPNETAGGPDPNRPDRFVSIDDPRDLYQVYSSWFSDLIGLEAIGGAERLEDGRAETFPIDPFVEQVVVTAIKDDPAVMVSLRAPDGTEVPLPPTQADKSHAVFSVDDPAAGQWEVSASGGGIDYYVWQRQPTLTLTGSPAEPSVSSRFLVTAGDLSDRLSEAGEDLQLYLTMTRDGQISSREMQREPYGGFTAALLGDVITEPGAYEFNVTASIDGAPVGNLAYEPLTRLFRPLPALGDVRINGDVIRHSGQPLEFERGEPLLIEIEVSQADLLSDEFDLTLRLPGQQLLDLTDNPFSINSANGNRVYTERVMLDEDQTAASLEVQLEGITNFEVPFSDDVTVDLAPLEVAVTVTVEVTPTAEATEISEIPITVTPSETDQSDNLSSALDVRWIIGALLISGVGVLAWRLASVRQTQRENEEREAERQRRLADAREGFIRARQLDDRVENLRVAKEFFKREDAAVDEVIGEVRQDSYEVLGDFVLLYEKDETPDSLYKDLAELSIYLDEHQAFHMPDFARFLFEKVWADKNPFVAIDGMYQLLRLGLPTEAFVSALAKADPTRRSLLFGALTNAIRHPDVASFALLQSQGESFDDEYKEGYVAVYSLLADFYSSEAFSVGKQRFSNVVTKLDRYGPKILGRLFSDVSEHLFPDTTTNGKGNRPSTKDNWTAILSQIEQAQAKTTKPEYSHLPEAEFVRLRLDTLKQIAQQEQRLLTPREKLPNKMGELLAEIRPSLDLFVSHELRASVVPSAWRTLQIPLVLYHDGDTRIQDVEVRSFLNENSSEAPGPTQRVVVEKHNVARIALDFALYVDRPSSVRLETSYETERIESYGLPLLQQPLPKKSTTHSKRIAMDRPVAVGAQPSYQRRSELYSPYISDAPLTEEQLRDLELSLSLPEQMMGYIKTHEFRPLLISVRGLRRTGKTTNLQALCRLLMQEGSSSNPSEGSFLTAEFDLMQWLARIKYQAGQSDLEIPFWREVLHQLQEGLQQIGGSDEVELGEQLQRSYDELSNGKQALVTVCKLLRAELKSYAGRSNRLVLFVFDEADLFSYFPSKEQDNIFKELATLSKEAGVPIIIAHDAGDAAWSDSMVAAFEAVIASDSSSARVSRDDYYGEFKTTLIDEASMNVLVKKGGLEFTDLALKTAWVLTGGYVTLIQALCNHLIVKRKSENREDEEPWVDVTVTADDVKEAVYDYSLSFKSMLGYLGHSFNPAEYLLMLVIASDHVSLDTGLLMDILYERSTSDADWRNTEVLFNGISRQFPDKLTPGDIQRLLTQLRQKQILEPVVIGEVSLPYVRWRVGWLLRYLRQSAQGDLTALLDQIGLPEQAIAIP